MKKVALISVLFLAACEAPMTRTVQRGIAPRVCVEYYDSFRCTQPVSSYNETIYPKNEDVMQYGYTRYFQY